MNSLITERRATHVQLLVVIVITVAAWAWHASPQADARTFSDNISVWGPVTNLPSSVDSAAAVVVGNWLYIFGGRNSSGIPVNTVWRASLNADGSLGAWQLGGTMPQPLYGHGAVTRNNRIYGVGGYSGLYQRVAYFTAVNSDGSLGAWQTTSPMLGEQERTACVGVATEGHI